MSKKFIGRIFTSLLAILLILPANIGMIAAEGEGNDNMLVQEPAITNLQPDSSWQASIFGDVGGQDKITATNFSVIEDEQGIVQMKSLNDRGKISSSTDGIAYLYQPVLIDQDFEFSATATVNSISDNNQASFGIMLRNKVYENIHGTEYGKDDYLALGGLDKKIKIFNRVNTVQTKQDLDESLTMPTAGSSYQLSIKKSENMFVIKVNDFSYVVDNYAPEVSYLGLFTARNADITYSDIQFNIISEEQPEIGELQFYSFGGNTSVEKNPEPVSGESGEYTLEATGGKLAGGDEGISYLAYEVPPNVSFRLEATATIESFNRNTSINNANQKSFGLMLRETVGEHRSATATTSNYVAVGALDTVMKGFYKSGVVNSIGGTQTKLNTYSTANVPAINEVYQLKIEKNQNSYTLTVNGESQLVTVEDLFSEQLYAGVYVARDAKVTFSNIKLQVETATVSSLKVDASNMKTIYRLQEKLNLEDLVVTAMMVDNSEKVLSEEEYIVTDFDSSKVGNKVLTIHYKGKTAQLHYEVVALEVTSIELVYEPAKTTYYVGDELQLQGLTIEANYEDGYAYQELTPDLYTIAIQDQVYDGYGNNEVGAKYKFTAAGTYNVKIISAENTNVSTEFTINVVDASLTSIEVRQLPTKTTYFINEALQLDGLIVYGHYSDHSSKRISRNDLTLSGFSTAVASRQELLISYRDQIATLSLLVKEKEAVKLVVTSYPKTTYKLGEGLDLSELELAIAFDNGELKTITDRDFIMDTSNYNAEVVGQYKLLITPNNEELESLDLLVTVREETSMLWESIRFGQSTTSSNNTIEVAGNSVVTLKAIGGSAGKVTGDHDGISFYYVELDAVEDNFELSADIKVLEYAKSPDHDGQESFGIMARDAIGTANDSSVFASNIAAIGGYSGGTSNPIGTQLFARTGIETSDGSGSQGIQSISFNSDRPTQANTYPAQNYRLTLAKTNSGFTGKLNDSTPVILYTPTILNVQDNKMYVGFYVARLATIEVHNIELKVTSAASDAPKVEPPLVPLDASIEFVSLQQTSTTELYEVKVKANTSGSVTIKQDNTIIMDDVLIEANQVLSKATKLMIGKNPFTISFIPSDTEYLKSYETIILNRTVTVKQYAGDMYVSPDGSSNGDGTVGNPLNLDTAITYVAPGQTIIVQDGQYMRNSKLDIKKYNDGTADAMKTLKAAEGARPVIDFDKKSEGVVLSGNYWHVIGLDFTRSAGNKKGFTIGGSHNIIELSRFYEHGDTGLQISRTDDSNNIADWPSYNLIVNSTSFANCDPSDNNADGFAAKLTSGVGNVFRGTIAYNNVDDGWDLYTKAGSGAIGAVTIENSIAYNNGYPMGSTELKGDGNGFKLGGEGIHVAHVIRDSIAFNNGTVGFASNSNPGVIADNNIGFNNPKGNIVFTTYNQITPDFTIDGFVSYATTSIALDQVPQSTRAKNNYLYDGTKFANSVGTVIAERNFKSLQVPLEFARDEEGNIILEDFLSFTAPKDANNSSNSNNQITEPTPTPTTSFKLKGYIENGKVTGKIASEEAKAAIALLKTQSGSKITITIEENRKEKIYRLILPSNLFVTTNQDYNVEIVTPIGSIVIPSFAFKNESNADNAEFIVEIRDVTDVTNTSNWSSDAIARPVLEFDFYWNGQLIDYNNLDLSLQLFVPYTPSTDEQNQLSKLAIWYIAPNGEITPIPNAYYDEKEKGMRWRTNHLSQYAIVLKVKNFSDVPNTHWAYEAVSTLAAKEVINGINESNFAPNESVTRADFVVMLMRCLGLAASIDNSLAFTDVATKAYYYEAVMTAQQLDIITGYPTGEFKPNQAIERQEMFVIAYKAIQKVEELQLSLAKDHESIEKFVDSATIAGYAKEILSTLVEHGVIQGYNEKINAKGETTRAEATVLIERLVFKNLNSR
ncbi:bacterial Ig-like domain-containing protein [Paenibacillus endoradicis]|uniref:bacterial Ig-like domain-containing protein n=1 Tax=Paenibacillus endoradicis TaxID=2972487 RepID=UPI002158A76A|nr:bacterial Ig-like domain-containing protein [Paenibacillus endoradicis]MCR8659762.1 bacterial Ig-like domain-containing protein [Paenibacillus endoradicis]